MRVKGYRKWDKESEEVMAMRQLGLRVADSETMMKIVRTRSDETIANMAIVLIFQADNLIYKFINSIEKSFIDEGGFREKMTRVRLTARKR